MSAQDWPTIWVRTAPSDSENPPKGVVALQCGSMRYHLDLAGAEALHGELGAVLSDNSRDAGTTKGHR